MSSRIEVLHQRFVDPLNPNPADIRIQDIAHALSNQCRFSGYTSRHYSVAEHSVYVAKMVSAHLRYKTKVSQQDHNRIVRQALLHDATEAYLVDLPTPIKKHFPEFRAAEKKLWTVIAKVFDVDEEMHPLVKEADGRMCTTEKLALLSDFVSPSEWGKFFTDFPPYTGKDDIIDREVVNLPRARRLFLSHYDKVSVRASPVALAVARAT